MSKKQKRYSGLDELMSGCEHAQSYFNSLPDYVQGMIRQRSTNIHTEKDLNRYAENLLAGDK